MTIGIKSVEKSKRWKRKRKGTGQGGIENENESKATRQREGQDKLKEDKRKSQGSQRKGKGEGKGKGHAKKTGKKRKLKHRESRTIFEPRVSFPFLDGHKDRTAVVGFSVSCSEAVPSSLHDHVSILFSIWDSKPLVSPWCHKLKI